jgi:hypothetical protein
MAELIKVYACPECEERVDERDFDETMRLYECQADGSFVSDSKNCPMCHKFAVKVCNFVCPDCESGWEEMPALVEVWVGDGEFFETEQEALRYESEELRAERRAAIELARVETNRLVSEVIQRERDRRHAWIERYRPLASWAREHLPRSIDEIDRLLEDEPGRPTIMIKTDDMVNLLLGEDLVNTNTHDWGTPESDQAWDAKHAQQDRVGEAYREMMGITFEQQATTGHPMWDGSAHGLSPELCCELIERLMVQVK